MIYIIHKMWVLFKNHLNYLKDTIFECFFKESNRLLLFFLKKNSQDLSVEEEKVIKDIRNLFRLKKELSYTVVREPFKYKCKRKKFFILFLIKKQNFLNQNTFL